MEETIDIKDLIRLLLSKIWIILLITFLGGATAFGISKTMLPLEYSSHITMYVQSYYGVSEGIDGQNNISNSKQLVNTYMEVLKDDAVMNAVGDMLSNQYDDYTLKQNFTYLNGRINPASIRSCLAISSVTDTSAVNIEATAKNAEIAASICNNLTSVAPEFVKNAVGVGSINTIDKAKVYDTPVAPNTMKNTLLGMVAGFMITALIIFVVDFFDNTVKDPDFINNRYNKAIIGEIQQFESDKKKKKKKNDKKNGYDSSDYVKLNDKNVPFSVVESYKSIRTNISFALSTDDKKIFAVSSANPGEGKSTTSANIAIAMAESGKKVLLIDADMRKSMQHKIFGLKNKKGLSTAISKMNNLEDCIQKSIVKNLDVMTAGPIPPNPSELLASKNMDDIMEKLNEQYDIIIIDTAPVSVVTDAMELANKVTGIVMVLRYAKTTSDDIDNAVKKMNFAQINVLGFIINGIKIKHRGKYYSKSSYYYKKGYGYYGVKAEPEEDEKKEEKK